MQWRDGVGITLEEFESVFIAVFGPLRNDEDLIDRIQNLRFSSTEAVDFGEEQLTTADSHLSRLRTFQVPDTPPVTVAVSTPSPPRFRNHGVSRVIGSTLLLPTLESPVEEYEEDDRRAP